MGHMKGGQGDVGHEMGDMEDVGWEAQNGGARETWGTQSPGVQRHYDKQT